MIYCINVKLSVINRITVGTPVGPAVIESSSTPSDQSDRTIRQYCNRSKIFCPCCRTFFRGALSWWTELSKEDTGRIPYLRKKKKQIVRGCLYVGSKWKGVEQYSDRKHFKVYMIPVSSNLECTDNPLMHRVFFFSFLSNYIPTTTRVFQCLFVFFFSLSLCKMCRSVCGVSAVKSLFFTH